VRTILLRGGRLIDPASRFDGVADLLVADGRIRDRAPDITPDDDTLTLDVSGAVVCPGLVDIHVHLREPGREDEETIESGAAAAAHGGVTSVAAMPNTEPAIDTPSWVSFVGSQSRVITVYPVAAATVGRRGTALTEMGELARAGAVAFSDDGDPIADPSVMRRALEYASMVGRPVISHCEDRALTGAGVMNEGVASAVAGLPAAPAAAEEVMVARDIVLARAAKARLHIAHVSTRGSVELIRNAKASGATITCETCPHYFTLTDEDVRGYDTNTRVNPPLRSADDVAAIKEGLADGTIDAIASDHAPHSIEEKEVEFDAAPPGVIGVETLLPLTLTHLVSPGTISMERAVELLSSNPARILDVPGGSLAVGSPADITVFDSDLTWKITEDWFRSRCRNSPFIGRTVSGRVAVTIAKGDIVFEEERTSARRHGHADRKEARGVRELSVHA
jgi:dihydroorotase